MKQFLAVGVVAAAVAASAQANIRITEVMSSSISSSPTPDWIEVTNYGSSAVSLANWRMDDGSFNFAVSTLLNGVASIGAGETVIFVESAGGALELHNRPGEGAEFVVSLPRAEADPLAAT